jgi:cell division initiation protein
MRLTPLDIEQRGFKIRFRGFDTKEVQGFLELIADEFKRLMDEVNSLKEALSNKVKEIEAYKREEESLKESVVNAQNIIKEMKGNAEKEAQLIVSEAELKAEKILNSAHTGLLQIREDISELKRQRIQFEMKLRSLIEAHLKLLDLENTEAEEEVESKLTSLNKD